jgi:hypothetical protein
MLESKIEKALIARVNALDGTCEKFVSPGRRGVPDRIVTLPGGRIIFVELKSPTGRLSPSQIRDHERRIQMGCDVRVINNLEAIDAFP